MNCQIFIFLLTIQGICCGDLYDLKLKAESAWEKKLLGSSSADLEKNVEAVYQYSIRSKSMADLQASHFVDHSTGKLTSMVNNKVTERLKPTNIPTENSSRRTIGSGLLRLTLDTESGDYVVDVNGNSWLKSAPAFFTANGIRRNAGDGLKLANVESSAGTDNLGSWTSFILKYEIQDTRLALLFISVEFRAYDDIPDAIMFGQHFPTAVKGTSRGPTVDLSSGFPSFHVDASGLGYLAYGGIMFGDTDKAIGKWNATDIRRIKSGLDSGPLVLFNGLGGAMVLSPFSSFMAMSSGIDYSSSRPTVSWGVLGSATEIPADFSTWSIISYSSDGINQAITKWGSLLRKKYNRGTEYRDSDITNNYIGYYTDNGAYYYYLTEQGLTYEQTIIKVKEYSQSINIPYRYVQYDSWFYPKDSHSGVTEWVAMPQLFPNGLQYLWNKTGWISVAHNRWWSDKTVYAKQNGGLYDFIVEPKSNRALPVGLDFWTDLMRESRKWGLVLYEQDWLNVQFDEMNATISSVVIGEQWLIQMGKGALNNGINIQYCMAPSRAALMTLLIPNVVQGRVSTDYLLEDDQWKIGISSMFAHALGVAPFKDNFWTTSVQPGNRYGLSLVDWRKLFSSNLHCVLQSVVATLSTGPVTPADKIGYSDPQLIMRSINADGLILKPSNPALSVDDQLYKRVFEGFKGEVWSTYSRISGLLFGVIFAANFDQTDVFPLTPLKAGFGKEFPESVTFSWFSGSPLDDVKPFNSDSPLQLKNCFLKDFCLYLTSPVIRAGPNKIILGGEMSKWVSMSYRRISSINQTDSEVILSLTGAAGETVPIMYSVNGSVITTKCVLSADGLAKLLLVAKRCVVM